MAKQSPIGWINNRRICSPPLNDHNRTICLSLFGGRLILTDCAGNEHYELTRAPKAAEMSGQEFTA